MCGREEPLMITPLWQLHSLSVVEAPTVVNYTDASSLIVFKASRGGDRYVYGSYSPLH